MPVPRKAGFCFAFARHEIVLFVTSLQQKIQMPVKLSNLVSYFMA